MSKLVTKEKPQQSIKCILNKPYVRRLLPDIGGGFTASIQEFPGLVAEGDTAEEALRNLDEAAESWISVAVANGREIREPIEFDGYSGKIALRIPRSLHQQVAELAELEGVSINQILTLAITNYTAGKKTVVETNKNIRAEFQYFLGGVNGVNLRACNITALQPYPLKSIGSFESYYTTSLVSNKPKKISGVNNG